MYFHTDSPSTIAWLADVLATAHTMGRSVRLAVGGDGSLKVKVGEGMWAAPIAGTPDPYREPPLWLHEDNTLCAAGPAEGADNWCDEHDRDLHRQ